MGNQRSLAECQNLIWDRAMRFVRLHVAGRKPIPDSMIRHRHVVRRDRALDLLIAAVEEHDRARVAFEETMANWRRRSAAAIKAWATRRKRARHAGKEGA